MTSRVAALSAALLLATAPGVWAQSQLSPGPTRPKEFVIGGVFAGPSSLGSTDVELLGGSGQPSQTLVRLDNKTRGYGLEVGMGVQLRRSLWMEVSGGWTRATVSSRIRNDFEQADSESVSTPMSRFILEGAVLKYFNQGAKSAWFVRGNAGWMREAAGGATLTGDGLIAGAGLGFRHWWRTAGKGSTRRMGLRLEGRAVVRQGGISLGESRVRFGPAATALLVFGY